MSYHLSTLAPLQTWIRLVWENRGVSPAYWGKLARILLPTTLAIPLRLAERIRYGRQVARTEIDKPPIIIIGFARSGTTHLHNLMWQDSQYGVISTFQASVPTFFLIGRGWLKRLIEKSTPVTRPMDNVKVSLDMPQEEEVAIANTCSLSTIHQLSFPQRAQTYFKKYTLMEDLSDRELRRWYRVYLEILRKATLDNQGRRLVLKSPTNMGRIAHLLRLFPDAKFVHIVRNPYRVCLSLMHMYRSLLPAHQFQPMDMEDLDDYVFDAYQMSMRQYLKDRALIPKGNLAEVRFEDLEEQPLAELERLYTELSLPGWASAQGPVSDYLETLSDYQKNRFSIDEAIANRIGREWKFALDTWDYQLPE